MLQPSQEKLKTILMQNFSFFWGGGGGGGGGGVGGGRGNKVHYGKCGSGECNCSLKPRSRFIASSGMRD